MGGVLMAIGDGTNGDPVYFEIPTLYGDSAGFDTVQKDTQFTWTNQPRLSRLPANQFTGPGDEVITIQGRLFPFLMGGTSTLDALRALGTDGKPQSLMRFSTIQDTDLSYAGTFVGYYVIRRVRSDSAKFAATGTPHRMEFTLELSVYGDDLGQNAWSTTAPSQTDGTLSDGAAAPAPVPDAPPSTSTTPNPDGGSTTQVLWSV